MEMTIEQAIEHGINQLEIFGGEHKKFIETALEIMRKYQKIKEQVDIAIDEENFAISDARLIQIREFINGNDD